MEEGDEYYRSDQEPRNKDGSEDEGDMSDSVDERADEEPVAEGEEPPPPKPEPSYAKANSVKFYQICSGLEAVWQASNRSKKKLKCPEEDKLKKILPVKVLKWLDEPSEGSDRPESVFPIYRLLLPERDSSRQFNVKEKIIAQLYAGLLGLSKTSIRYKKLFDYGDPKLAGRNSGDFPAVVEEVVGQSKVSRKGSDFTVGDINKALDDFVALRALSSSKGDKKNQPKLQDLRGNWLEQLNKDAPGRMGLSALENKWLVRILTKNMRIGLVSCLFPL